MLCTTLGAAAQGTAVVEVRYTPVPRAQVAIWIEDTNGEFLATVALTEAVAFRGIGNRPGASQMNSGYRWPYGRREGVLPIWAHRRAGAPGAKQFRRVIFQKRVEGFASQTVSDQSEDDYFCLQFDVTRARKDNLDAVSCATQFHSDKGRYLTSNDVDAMYSEPWEVRDTAGAIRGETRAMPVLSVYPPRMDSKRCTVSGACFDHVDVDQYATDVRAVMPEIDVVTRATPPGDVLQRILFTVPNDWPRGDYVAWLEINVEGDYTDEQGTNDQKSLGWNDVTFPTPSTPMTPAQWDSWATGYGYPYRGQPSVAFKVPFSLGDAGETVTHSDMPAGRSSWDHWAPDYGTLEPITFAASDARHMSDHNGSGADRLRRDDKGHRVAVSARVMSEFREPTVPPPDPTPDGGVPEPMLDAGVMTDPPDEEPLPEPPVDDGVVGPIRDLKLRHHPDVLRAHTWINLAFRAAKSAEALHEYEVRVSTQPIMDEASFLRDGRPAKNATDDAEGATALMLPVDIPAGSYIQASIGDLVPDTRYFVAVRATDVQNRHGRISVAEINTPRRVFATVTPCFVATAAYGTPLAAEIDALRRFRDRYLGSTAPGRALVSAYESFGPHAARVIAGSEDLRAFVRALLTPVVALARRLP